MTYGCGTPCGTQATAASTPVCPNALVGASYVKGPRGGEAGLRGRVLGALVGMAYGDAFGMPVEGWDATRIASRFGWVDRFLPGPMDNEIAAGLAAGETTDDTAASLMVAESLVEHGGHVDPLELMAKLRLWAETSEKAAATLGPSTRRAFDLMDAGAPVEVAGRGGVTNGGAMRIVPVGVVAPATNLEALIDEVHRACLPTHNTSPAIAAASAVAAAVSAGVMGVTLSQALDASELAARLGERCGAQMVGPSVAARISLGRDIVARSRSEAAARLRISGVLGCTIQADESVPAALAFAAAAWGDPVRCARLATNAGGDTDTIASMACAVCGAVSGIDAFPGADVELLERVNGIDFTGLAADLCAVRGA